MTVDQNSPNAPSEPLLYSTLDIVTPELVSVHLPLAEVGTRLFAGVIDLAIVGLVYLLLLLLAVFTRRYLAAVSETALTIAIAVTAFVVFSGYHFFWETFDRGRTPGKRVMGIRVLRDDGLPANGAAIAVRSLIRPIDVTLWIGMVSILGTRRRQRLGDFAAGTVVVRSSAQEIPIPAPDIAPGGILTVPLPAVDDSTFDLLTAYLRVRGRLSDERRRVTVLKLLERLAPLVPRTGDVQGYLDDVAREEIRRRRAREIRRHGAAAVGLLHRKRASWLSLRDSLGVWSRRKHSGAEIVAMATQVRATAVDLARARTWGASERVTAPLEWLVAEGSARVHSPQPGGLKSVLSWLSSGFPRLVRALIRPIALSALVFYGSALLAGVAVRQHPERGPRLAGPVMVSRADEGRARMAQGVGYADAKLAERPLMAAGIMMNNIKVSFMVFAGGVGLGVLTLILLASNGVSLGASYAYFLNRGLGGYLVAFILPHGGLELTAICIAGGAGLHMASGMLMPGRRLRRTVLAERAREAVQLVIGVMLILIVAGLIEGYLSPSRLPILLKQMVALTAPTLLFAWLVLGGRRIKEVNAAAGTDR